MEVFKEFPGSRVDQKSAQCGVLVHPRGQQSDLPGMGGPCLLPRSDIKSYLGEGDEFHRLKGTQSSPSGGKRQREGVLQTQLRKQPGRDHEAARGQRMGVN